MSLKDDLTEIQGVGDATADKIVSVVEGHDTGGVDPADVEKALAFLERNHASAAENVLADALGE